MFVRRSTLIISPVFFILAFMFLSFGFIPSVENSLSFIKLLFGVVQSLCLFVIETAFLTILVTVIFTTGVSPYVIKILLFAKASVGKPTVIVYLLSYPRFHASLFLNVSASKRDSNTVILP